MRFQREAARIVREGVRITRERERGYREREVVQEEFIISFNTIPKQKVYKEWPRAMINASAEKIKICPQGLFRRQ